VSRAIQVRVSESIVRTIHVEDGVASPLEMLPILPAARMAELLAGELAALGFIRDGNVCRRTEADGTEVTIDLAAATIAVSLGAGAQIDESIERTVQVAIERKEAAEASLRDSAVRELDARLAEHAEALRRRVTAQLEAKLGDLKIELDRAIGRATVAALTEKAGQLGQIESTHEDEAGNVTIRVRL
jgi:FtsH ternary system-associated peptide